MYGHILMDFKPCCNKGNTSFWTITLAFLGRFLSFFYHWKQNRSVSSLYSNANIVDIYIKFELSSRMLLLSLLLLLLSFWLHLEIRDIWHPGAGPSGMRDRMAQIRDIPGNPGWVATLQQTPVTNSSVWHQLNCLFVFEIGLESSICCYGFHSCLFHTKWLICMAL